MAKNPKVSQQIWDRWSKEYLSQLQERNRWGSEKGPKINLGSIVMVKDNNALPLQWKLGLVKCLRPDNEGISRVATIKTLQGEYRRTIRYLYPLPFECNNGP